MFSLRTLVIPTFIISCVSSVKNSETIINTTIKQSKYDANYVYPIIGQNISLLKSIIEQLPKDKCWYELTEFVHGVSMRKSWAMQMLDSTPKFPVGLMFGENYQLGNFDECLDVHHVLKDEKSSEILQQYCTANIYSNNDKSKRGLIWALCLPSSCPEESINEFISKIFNAQHINVEVSTILCYKNSKIIFDNYDVSYMSILLIYLAIILLATIYSVFYFDDKNVYTLNGTTTNDKTIHKIILSFSLVQNVSKILSVRNKNDLNLPCISGLKFVLMTFVVAGHTLLFAISGPVMNGNFYEEAKSKVQNGLFLNNPLLVDSFLFLSAFLFTCIVLHELDKRRGKINFVGIYLARYFRLTPAYIVVIGFYCSIFVKLNQGPLWNVVSKERDRCLNSWWANILYINNYVGTDNLCMFQSWYLATDTQLFFMAPFIIYPLWRYKHLGKVLLGVVTFLSLTLRGLETYSKNLFPTLMIYPKEVFDLNENPYFKNTYIKTHLRFGSYCMGILFGYVLYKIQITRCRLSPLETILGWIISSTIGLSSLLTISVFYKDNYQYNAIESGVYAALHSIGWCIFIGWITIACISGYCETMNKFLSWKLFVPLGRLTYCAYLVNGMVELHHRGTLRTSQYLSVYSLCSMVLSHLVLTYALAFIICILFESPIHSLEKILMQNCGQTRNQDLNNTSPPE